MTLAAGEELSAGRDAGAASKRMRIVIAVFVTIACLLATALTVLGSPAAPELGDENQAAGLGGWGSWERSGSPSATESRWHARLSALDAHGSSSRSRAVPPVLSVSLHTCDICNDSQHALIEKYTTQC
jgi:hypothetical protein